MTCPVVRAINEIRGGMSADDSRGVVIGSGEDAVTYHGGEPTFRATAAKLELARAKIGGAALYRGDLLRFVGNSKHFALCYLLGASTAGTVQLRECLQQLYDIAKSASSDYIIMQSPELCMLYPNTLRRAINGAIDDLSILNVEYLPQLNIDTSVYDGLFPNVATSETLESIANDLLAIAKVADAMSEYHLIAAQKISEIMSRMR